MAPLSLKYNVVILAFVLVFTPLKCNGSECKLSAEEELTLKQGKMDHRINYLERMLQNIREEIAGDAHGCCERSEEENAKLWEFVNLLANVSNNRNFIEAYRSGSCHHSVSPVGYTGHMSTTKSGRTCQRWDSRYPHNHTYVNDVSKFPDDSVHEASNYCRDPSEVGYLWCYTTDPDERWEACIVSRCLTEFDPEVCYSFGENSNTYAGDMSVTYTGKTCQKWSSQYPHSHDYVDEHTSSNHCRDPSGWGQPWCYTTDSSTRWELCDVARCIE